jgi:hypothetical protein
MSVFSQHGMPCSLEVRPLDRAAYDELVRAARAVDRRALSAICEIAEQRLSDVTFRRAPGPMSDVGWHRTTVTAVRSLRELLAPSVRSEVDFDDELSWRLEPLVSAYALPFFQTHYELVVRGGELREWTSTRDLKEKWAAVRIFRALRDHPSSMQARIEVPEPCSFVSLGFLDGGTYRSLRERKEAEIVRLLTRADECGPAGWADIMWAASTEWLAELIAFVRAESDAHAQPVLEHLTLLRAEAQGRGYQIAVSAWFGDSVRSELAPLSWGPRSG